MQILLSLPPAIANDFACLEGKSLPEWVPAHDPPGFRLGSGGGTANLLASAWQQTGAGRRFQEWLRASKKLLIHAGGESRRLPAYAHCGKALMPIPVFRWAKGQRLDQTLLDLQLPLYRRILENAPKMAGVMVTSGDVLLRSAGPLPPLPEVDVLCFGQWVQPEAASNHGVFFCKRTEPDQLNFFLQKPSTARIRELSTDHLFLIDTGIWLLSEAAVRVVMERSGWDWSADRFQHGQPEHFELYADLGLGLGASPTAADRDVRSLTAAVVPLPKGEFYHFGISRDLVRSCSQLQNLVLDQRELSITMLKPNPDMYVQNTLLDQTLTPENHTLWVDNAMLPPQWSLTCEHVLTGIPHNDWALTLPRGICLDMVPIGETKVCVRVYGIDDMFRGPFGGTETTWCGAPAQDWLAGRGIRLAEAGFGPDVDIQNAPIFPILEADALDGSFIQWLIDGTEETTPDTFPRRWLNSDRRSASQLIEDANLPRLYDQRHAFRQKSLLALVDNSARSIFYNLDLDHTAKDYSATGRRLPDPESVDAPLMRRVHQRMFFAAVRRWSGEDGWQDDEETAFGILRKAIVESTRQAPVRPEHHILDDQIIWGRSPIRLDLAGGWTDTPPYCLIHGGQVVNVAVDLNGQPPIQTFIRISEKPHVLLRSIDLGVEERITTYDELRNYANVGSGFSIAKAALALAGFLPEFCQTPGYSTLRRQLETFGGGIEISLLAAIPKGSGLGTSSILSATLLGTLSDLCGFNWDHAEICRRTLALEQMLTTGGGWQDQLGGIVRGMKLIETALGLIQEPVIRWLPVHLFTDPVPKSCMLLYYTGITRVAKNILKEIVRGMFLNSTHHTSILQSLSQHAAATYDVLLRGEWDGLCQCIRRSWDLNQRLDKGTNPPAIQSILNRIDDYLAATKLLGAGGGGYMLMLAKDQEAAIRIRKILTEFPPTPKARFVDFAVSQTGLEITRS